MESIKDKISNKDFTALIAAKEELLSGVVSCVAIMDGEIIFRDKGRGVSCLLKLYETRPSGELIIADKLVGKAAATLAVLIGAKAVYATVLSQEGKKFLQAQSIPFCYDTLTEKITNMRGDDYCPIEKCVLSTSSPSEALQNILETLQKLKQASN